MIDDIEVLFPYDYIYPEQYEYMVRLRQALSEGHALLEMPTGTGKTITLLTLLLAYQYKYANPADSAASNVNANVGAAAATSGAGKIVYCTRTVQEMDKVIEEMKFVMEYRNKIINEDRLKNPSLRSPEILGVCLSSRRNLCVHPVVSKYDSKNRVDALCRNLTASFVRERKQQDPTVETCSYYDGFQLEGLNANLNGIYSIGDLKSEGESRGWCPYYWARHLINTANIIVYNYQYMLDPKISGLVSKEFDKESIIVFDEAPNIDNIAI
jgi:DNA excision repair protein ERCC-2